MQNSVIEFYELLMSSIRYWADDVVFGITVS
jgi:hypothetical protein